MIEEVRSNKQRICCFYFDDMTCKLGISHCPWKLIYRFSDIPNLAARQISNQCKETNSEYLYKNYYENVCDEGCFQ